MSHSVKRLVEPPIPYKAVRCTKDTLFRATPRETMLPNLRLTLEEMEHRPTGKSQREVRVKLLGAA